MYLWYRGVCDVDEYITQFSLQTQEDIGSSRSTHIIMLCIQKRSMYGS